MTDINAKRAINEQVEAKLKEKNLTWRHLVWHFLYALEITHVHAGFVTGKAQTGINSTTGIDKPFIGGDEPRSLLEALLARVKSQYAQDKHNLGVKYDPDLATVVSCGEIAVWLLQAFLDLCENTGMQQAIWAEEWIKKQGQSPEQE